MFMSYLVWRFCRDRARPETTTLYRSHAGEVSARVERRKLGLTRLTSFAVSGRRRCWWRSWRFPRSWRVTGFVAIPAAYLAALAVLWVFTTGFVAMARHVNSPGAFYIYICRGLAARLGGGRFVRGWPTP